MSFSRPSIVVAVLGLGACADPCVDDGLSQDSADQSCAIASGTADDSGSGSSSDSVSASMSATMSASATESMSASNSNSGTADSSGTESDSNSATDTNSASNSATDTDSASNSATDTDSASNSATDTDSASSTGPSEDCSDGMQNGDETDLDCGGSCGDNCEVGEQCLVDLDCQSHDCGKDGTCQPATLWCVDADGDGFGDAADCMMVPEDEDPPPGTVDNDDDCDDGDADTFPGAAPNDDPVACMKDADGDDWGDDTPPGTVDAGSDCDEDGLPPCVLVVTQDGTNGNSYDQGLEGVLGDLGFVITWVADTDAELTDANGFTLVVISETAQSTDIAGTFQDVIVPTVCLEGLVWDDMGMAPEGTVSASDSVDILAAGDPLAGGLLGTVDVIMGGGAGTFFTSPAIGATAIASEPNAAGNVVDFAFEEGATMEGGFVAPRRRVGFGLDADQGNGSTTILTDGLTLFEAAVLWAIG